MLKIATQIGVTLIFVCLATSAQAEAYKWTDPTGNIIYSQTPPPIGTPFEVVEDTNLASTSTSKNQQGNSGSLQESLDSNREKREEKISEKQRLAESEQIKKQNCSQAKKNLSALTSRGQVTIKEGELYRKLSEEERQERIKDAQSGVEEFCG